MKNQTYLVTVGGIDKGEVFKTETGRWRWFKETRGTEQYRHGMKLVDVRFEIARLCRVELSEVVFKKLM